MPALFKTLSTVLSVLMIISIGFSEGFQIAQAQTTPPQQPNNTLQAGISLTEALQIAEKNNPQLLAAQKNRALSEYDIKIAKEIPNPTVQYAQTLGSVQRILASPNVVTWDQTIETDRKRSKRVRAAKSQLVLTVDQYNALYWDTRSQVRQAYADLAAANENINLVVTQTQLAQQLVDIASKRVNAGAAPVSEELQAELALNQLVSQRIQADTQLKQAKIHFNALLGVTLTEDTSSGYQTSDTGYLKAGIQKTEIVPFPDSPLPKLDDLYTQAQKSRPDLIAAAQQVAVYQDQIRLAKALRVPDLQLSLGYEFVRQASQYSPDLKTNFFDGPIIQGGFVLPLFQNQQAEIGKLKATLSQAELQFNATKKQMNEEVHTAYSTLLGARDNINLYQTQLIPKATDVLHLSQESYQYGKTGLSNVILAQQSEQQILQSYFQAVVDYQKAWGDLEKAVGKPLVF